MLSTDPKPALYVVATPLGNLSDLSPRAAAVLNQVDIVAAEDTRHFRKLAQLANLSPRKIVSYYDQCEEEKSAELIEIMLTQQWSVALVSDAGTPCISDPGYRLIEKAHQKNIKVIPIPGPSSLTTMISVSGLPNHRVLFIGFLPQKAAALKSEALKWKDINATVVFLESSKRILKSLQLINQIYPKAKVAVGRELTKKHEEIAVFEMPEALVWAAEHKTLKGEITCMLSPCSGSGSDRPSISLNDKEIMARFKKGENLRSLLAELAVAGVNKNELYTKLLSLKKQTQN